MVRDGGDQDGSPTLIGALVSWARSTAYCPASVVTGVGSGAVDFLLSNGGARRVLQCAHLSERHAINSCVLSSHAHLSLSSSSSEGCGRHLLLYTTCSTAAFARVPTASTSLPSSGPRPMRRSQKRLRILALPKAASPKPLTAFSMPASPASVSWHRKAKERAGGELMAWKG